ncbi:MAG: hypothetical protein LBT40_14540 [Deltaproteobacteria bacterium]|nr:hypothetical protein [Deltaproteobacteria bacterium]
MTEIDRVSCPNPKCRHYGMTGMGNVAARGLYGRNRDRPLLYCRTCGKRFSLARGGPLFWSHVPDRTVHQVMRQHAGGMGVRALSRSTGLSTDTVSRLLAKVGAHCLEALDATMEALHLPSGSEGMLLDFLRARLAARTDPAASRRRGPRAGSPEALPAEPVARATAEPETLPEESSRQEAPPPLRVPAPVRMPGKGAASGGMNPSGSRFRMAFRPGRQPRPPSGPAAPSWDAAPEPVSPQNAAPAPASAQNAPRVPTPVLNEPPAPVPAQNAPRGSAQASNAPPVPVPALNAAPTPMPAQNPASTSAPDGGTASTPPPAKTVPPAGTGPLSRKAGRDGPRKL